MGRPKSEQDTTALLNLGDELDEFHESLSDAYDSGHISQPLYDELVEFTDSMDELYKKSFQILEKNEISPDNTHLL